MTNDGGPGSGTDPRVRLAERTWTELEPSTALTGPRAPSGGSTGVQGDRPILVVPVGSLEQHGPHLPLDTDTRVAEAVATAVAHRCAPALVAPAVPYGASGEHADFPGTLSVSHDVLAATLVELVRSARSVFAGVLFVSGHGGNRQALDAMTATCRYEGDTVAVWEASAPGTDAHAGCAETSLLLAIAPESVRRDCVEGAAGRIEPLAELWPRLVEDGVRAVSPNGVLGDPRGASAEAGWALLEQMVQGAVAVVERMEAVGPVAAVADDQGAAITAVIPAGPARAE